MEAVVVAAIMTTVLAATAVGVRGYLGVPTLVGWSEVIVNDIRAAQQLSIAQRTLVTMVFTPKGSNPANYTITVGGAGGTIVRQQNVDFSLAGLKNLSANLDVTGATLQFSSLGVPVSGVTMTLSDSTSGNTVTITVNELTGAVTTQ